MSDPIIYKGRGTPEMYDDLMDFLNYVFGFDGDGEDFKKTLPKLYNPECDPCHANYVVTENGKLKAAIGAFDSDVSVGGEVLHCRGIGNVAVHPYSRSKGYMIDCMNRALEGMKADGVDYSILGGRRQRYGYFGFDNLGTEYRVSVNRNNMRYIFGKEPFVDLELHRVEAEDAELLDQMYALHAARPLHTVRPREKFFDIARSWYASVWAILKDGDFRGYFVGNLQELTLVDPADFNDVVRNYVRKLGEVTIRIPAWDTELLEAAMKISEHTEIGECDMFNVLNYERMVGAFLRFKASYDALGDGEITTFIHGYAGDCKLKIAVQGGVPAVEAYDGDCRFEFSHFEAMQFFFGLHSPYRRELAPEMRCWFPLPLYIEPADHV